MRIARFTLAFFTGILMLASCQKELNFDDQNTSAGRLKADFTGTCLPATVNGLFRADSVVNESNFIEVQVDVAQIGNYIIYSDTVNGYSFRAEGQFQSTGLRNVRLTATGTPQAEGTDTFTIHYNTSLCEIAVIVIGPNSGNAVFTMGSGGTCAGVIMNGIFQTGIPMNNTNYLQMTVNVTQPGIYNIQVPAVNGIGFSGAGVFANNGLQSVTLYAAGTPVTAGNFNLTASSAFTSCTFSLNVAPSGSGGTAVFSFDATASACNGAVLSGTYTAGTSLNASNTVILTVNVTTAGTYTIATGVVNGVTFSKSGNFINTGIQTVTLTGSGSPTGAGAFNFSASSITANCVFSVNFSAVAASVDYLPTTTGSNWAYLLQGAPLSDSTHQIVLPNNITLGGNAYRIFSDDITADSTFYRKNGAKYYQYYRNVDFGFDQLVNAEVTILDSLLAVNGTWNSPMGNYTVTGIPITLSISSVILERGASVTIGSITFNNVIKVKSTYNYNDGTGNQAFLEEETWFARGIGIIQSKVNDVPLTTTETYQLFRYQVL